MAVTDPALEYFDRMVIQLVAQWQIFEELYIGTGNFDLFNRTGPTFWDMHREMHMDSIFMSISRWLDPASAGRGSSVKNNFSLDVIVAHPEHVAIRFKLKEDLKDLRKIWRAGIKDWRDWRISHHDYNTVLRLNPLPSIPYEDIRKIVDGIFEILDQSHFHRHGGHIGREVHVKGGVSQLLGYLREGVHRMDERRESLRASLEPVMKTSPSS